MGIFSYVIYPENPHLRVINKAVEILKNDGVIIYPTDTVYAFGAALSSKKGIEKIYRLKKMSSHKLLSFIVSDFKNLSQYAYVSNHAYKLMKRCVPGPFTFILPATKIVPKLLYQKRRTVGIRIPDSVLSRQIVDVLGEPLITSSVPHGQDGFFTDPQEIILNMENDVDMVLDAGVIHSEPSTIVDLSGDVPEILRKGAGDLSLIY